MDFKIRKELRHKKEIKIEQYIGNIKKNIEFSYCRDF